MKNSKLFALFSILFLSFLCKAQERPMHEIHAMMVYNFMKYIEWPNDVKTGEFVVAIVGDQELFNTFNSYYSSKRVGTQPILVKYFESVSFLSQTTHLVYLAQKNSNEFESLKAKLQGKPTLVVTDRTGLGKKGSCINFKVLENKLKFEINQESINQAQLKVSNALISMAIII